MKKPRLSDEERLVIESMLRADKTVYEIAKTLARPVTTIIRKVKARAVESDKGAAYRVTNRCAFRMECEKRHVCAHCLYDGNRLCKFCRQCNSHCPAFVEQRCERLDRSQYVCNGCTDERKCVLRKRYYLHAKAQENYETILSESRTGANVSEKTDYRYINGGLLSTKRGDLPRACMLRPRKGKGVEHRGDKTCRVGRTLEGYIDFIEKNPGVRVVEMDTVEGGKVLLTLTFNRRLVSQPQSGGVRAWRAGQGPFPKVSCGNSGSSSPSRTDAGGSCVQAQRGSPACGSRCPRPSSRGTRPRTRNGSGRHGADATTR